MSLCPECDKKIDRRTKNIPKCHNCGVLAHTLCAKKKSSDNNPENFTCKVCKGAGEVRSAGGNTTGEMDEVNKKLDKILSKQDMMESKLTSIDNKISGIETKIQELEVRVEALDPLVKYDSDRIDDLESKFKTLGERVIKMEKTMEKDSKEVCGIVNDMEYIKMRNRKHNVEIQGIPHFENEDKIKLINIVAKVTHHFKVEIDKTNVRDIHRIPTFNNKLPQPIIVSFNSIVLRDLILEKVYENYTMREGLTGHSIGLSENNRIFVATHLTPSKKELFKKARDAKKANGVQYVWERYGTIFAKASSNTARVKINNEEDIKKVISHVSAN